jgi:hypothetical protein
MAHEERLIDGDVLDTDDALFLELQDLIHQQHGIAVRKNLADRHDVEEWHEKWLL